MTDDKRNIGYIHNDKTEWPKTDIIGQPYSRPPIATAGLGGNRFAVLPYGFWNNPEILQLLDELRQRHAPPKSKRQQADETEAQEGGG